MILATQNVSNNVRTFPKLMTLIEDGGIFLFLSEKVAICIIPDNGKTWDVGQSSEFAAINHFTDYNEPITIQNA